MLTNGLQACIEGIAGISPHIGGDALHRMCYDALQPSWREWSNNYCVPLERTTLRGLTIYAPIAGKARQQPAKELDAILDQFMTTRKDGKQVFKARQLELVLVIDNVDFQHAEERRNPIYELDEIQSHNVTKVCENVCIVFVWIAHSTALDYRPLALGVNRKRLSQIPVQLLH